VEDVVGVGVRAGVDSGEDVGDMDTGVFDVDKYGITEYVIVGVLEYVLDKNTGVGICSGFVQF